MFDDLTTPLVADACMRRKVQLRAAAEGVRPLAAGMRLDGRALPVRHAGSTDVFLEAIEQASPGDVLVIDNDGRLDEGCIGDLTVIEAAAAGLSGLLVWGAHRDTAEILALATPVFSYGSMPVGPLGARGRHPEALRSARVGEVEVTRADHVFGDDDGVLFVPADRAEEVAKAARAIRERERAQAEQVRTGTSLRAQLRFVEYLERRRREPSWTFRDHLREIGGAIEE